VIDSGGRRALVRADDARAELPPAISSLLEA
jgi:hypothetical protein